MIDSETTRHPAQAQLYQPKMQRGLKETLIRLPIDGPPISYCFRCGQPASVPFTHTGVKPTAGHFRRFYLCSNCERLRQQIRSSTWAKEAAFFCCSFGMSSWYFLRQQPLEPVSTIMAILMWVFFARFVCLFTGISFKSLGLNRNKKAKDDKNQLLAQRDVKPEYDESSNSFLLKTCNPHVIDIFSDHVPGAKVEGALPHLPKKGAWLVREMRNVSAHLIVLTLWLTALLSQSVEVMVYQGTWGQLHIIVDHQNLGRVKPSALETPSALISRRLWPGTHLIEIVDESGRLKTQLTQNVSSEKSYLLAYLTNEYCVHLEVMQATAQGIKTVRRELSAEENLYILPKIDRWLAPLPSEGSQSDDWNLIAQAETRYALRINPCNSAKRGF